MELLADVAGAQVAPESEDVYPIPVERERIRVRTSRVNQVLGTALDAEEVWDALAPLEIELEQDDTSPDSDTLVSTVPTFRPDLEREIDLVEEVARRIGFDRIGRTLPDTHGQVGALTRRQRNRRLVADALVGIGLSEAITLPLVSPADLERAGAPLDRVVRATNPLRAEESVLRTRILAGLLRAVAFNRSHGLADVALFEMGHVFDARVERWSTARRAGARRGAVAGGGSPPSRRGGPPGRRVRRGRRAAGRGRRAGCRGARPRSRRRRRLPARPGRVAW